LQFEKAAISHDDKAVYINLLLIQGWEQKPTIVSIVRSGSETDFYELFFKYNTFSKNKEDQF